MSCVITLTSDFGYRDAYVASMKGAILSIEPDTTIVDITNDVPPQDILHGAFVLSAAFSYFPQGTVHVAVVDVDPATGVVKVLRYLVVGDNGTVINPDVVEGQVVGSAAHGISVALGEGLAYDDDGNIETKPLLEYGKASTMDTPSIEVEHRPQPSPFTALGQKAVGEGAAIASPASIASAVEDALRPLGAVVEQLPLDIEAVWSLANGRASLRAE